MTSLLNNVNNRIMVIKSVLEPTLKTRVSIHSNSIVSDIKEQLHIILGITPENLNLIYNGHIMQDYESVDDILYGIFWISKKINVSS